MKPDHIRLPLPASTSFVPLALVALSACGGDAGDGGGAKEDTGVDAATDESVEEVDLTGDGEGADALGDAAGGSDAEDVAVDDSRDASDAGSEDLDPSEPDVADGCDAGGDCEEGPPDDPNECPTADPGCVDWRYMTDALGRARFYYGVNVDGAAKGISGLPPITQEEVTALSREHGFNLARYLVFWSRIEPEPRAYDSAYLDAVEERLDWMAGASIDFVLDMHQDCYSGPAISGEGSNGAPAWATQTDGEPHDQQPGFWSLCYLSSDVVRAFDNFWDYAGHPELQDAYVAMWTHVAERFRGHPGLLGYDIMNEPWEGSLMLNQQRFDETKYFDFLRRVIAGIRSVDRNAWIFWEPRAFGVNQSGPSFIPRLEDPRAGNSRLVYFPHFYPVAYETGYVPGDDGYVDRWRSERSRDIRTQQSPMLSGEWSTLPFDDFDEATSYFDRMNEMLDAISSGWAFWDRSVMFNEDIGGGHRPVELLARPHPVAVAGQPTAWSYSGGVLSLAWETRARVEGATEIYLPADWGYPDGTDVVFSDAEGSWTSSWDGERSILRIVANPLEASHSLAISRAE